MLNENYTKFKFWRPQIICIGTQPKYFMHCLWLLLHYNGSTEKLWLIPYGSQGPKYFLIFYRKVNGSCYGSKRLELSWLKKKKDNYIKFLCLEYKLTEHNEHQSKKQKNSFQRLDSLFTIHLNTSSNTYVEF